MPALNQDGTPAQPIHQDDGDDKGPWLRGRPGRPVSWPKGTGWFSREPLHPGAQTSLLPDLEYRFWGHYTDQDGDPATLDRQMRAHAHVEDHIGRLKDSGLLRFPFTDFAANAAWLAVVCWGADLVRWCQLLCVTGPLARALPKRLRWQLWHTPARIVRKARGDIIRILDVVAHRPRHPRRLPTRRRPHLTGAPLQSRTPAVEQPRPHAPRTSPPAPPDPRPTPISQPTPHHNPNHPSTPTNQTSRE